MLPIVHEFIHEIVVAGLLGIAGSAASTLDAMHYDQARLLGRLEK